MRQLGRWCMICWTQASLFETCDEVLRKTLRFHSFDGTPWRQLVFGSWADASDRPRPDGTRTGGFVITLATEESFGQGQDDGIQFHCIAILQTAEINCWVQQRRATGSCVCKRKHLVGTSRLVRDALCSVAAVASRRSSSSSGRHAHHGFSRHLRRLDTRRVSSVTITECSHWRGGIRHEGTVLSLKHAFIG